MQHYDPVAYKGAVEDAGNAFRRLEPELKKSAAHRACVRQAKVRPVNFHTFRITQEPGNKTSWKTKYLHLEIRTVKETCQFTEIDYSIFAILSKRARGDADTPDVRARARKLAAKRRRRVTPSAGANVRPTGYWMCSMSLRKA